MTDSDHTITLANSLKAICPDYGGKMSQPGTGAAEFDLDEHRKNIADNALSMEDRILRYMSSTPFPVVCICGSMRFYPWMLKVAERYTLDRYIVLLPLVRKDSVLTDAEKKHQHLTEQALPDGVNLHIMLDAMHRRKIDMADEIIVCTDGVGYFGDSTRGEITFASERGKTIRFERDPSGPQPGEDLDDYK